MRASNDVVLADPHPIRPPSVTADAEVSSFQVEDKKILLSGDSESMMPAGDAEATTPGLIQLAVDDSTSVSSDDDVSVCFIIMIPSALQQPSFSSLTRNQRYAVGRGAGVFYFLCTTHWYLFFVGE